MMLLMQVRFPGAARGFLPRVNFQCRLSFSVRTPPCAITCNNICAHDKDPVVDVRVWWIMAKQRYPACTISHKNNQLDDCGHSRQAQWACCSSMDIFTLYKLSSSFFLSHLFCSIVSLFVWGWFFSCYLFLFYLHFKSNIGELQCS